jgi:hypothetical protein
MGKGRFEDWFPPSWDSHLQRVVFWNQWNILYIWSGWHFHKWLDKDWTHSSLPRHLVLDLELTVGELEVTFYLVLIMKTIPNKSKPIFK